MSTSREHSWGILHRLRHDGETPAIRFIPNASELERVCWIPSDELRGDLPEHVAPQFVVIKRHGADAAIVPLDDAALNRDPLHYFLHLAWHFGREIIELEHPESWNQDVANSYSVMWFLYRRFHRTKAFSTRRFNTRNDFLNGGKGAAFPWGTDIHAIPHEYPNSIEALLELGESRAEQLDLIGPTYSQKLHYGLAAAARIQPLQCNDPEAVRHLVRTSLFARQYPVELSPSARERIEELLIEALLRTAKSDRGMAEFDAWLLGRRNSLVKQLAQTLRTSIDNASNCVHQYLAESGIRAMDYISGCITRLMREVERGLIATGIGYDRELFAMLYYPQSYFDDIPLILLREKLEFFEGTIESLRVGHENAVSEFHSMLWFYAQMVEDRRRLDRDRSPSRASRRSGMSLEATAPSADIDDVDMERLVEMLVESEDLTCPCDPPQWICLNPQSIPMSFRCKNCQSEVRLGDSQEN